MVRGNKKQGKKLWPALLFCIVPITYRLTHYRKKEAIILSKRTMQQKMKAKFDLTKKAALI